MARDRQVRPRHYRPTRLLASPNIIIELAPSSGRTGRGAFIGGGIPMVKDELVASFLLGAIAAFISVLVGGRWLVDLIATGI